MSLLRNPTEPVTLLGTGAQLVRCSGEYARVLGAAFASMLPWSRYPFSPAALEQYLCGDEPGAPRFCLCANGEPAGALGLRLNWLRGPYIQFLGVLPQYQSTGLGGAILTQVLAEARENSDRNVWVAASDFNAAALRFYERHGFTRAALLDGVVQDDIGEVLLRRRL